MTTLGFIVLCLAWLACKVLAVPLIVATYVAIAVPLALGLAAVIVLVAVACRGVDKVRGV